MPPRASAPAPQSGTPLGLKYTLLKFETGGMTDVSPDTMFHAGDEIQFKIETNGPGYLYIVAQGSSGAWTPMFPSPDANGGTNYVQGFHEYTFPPGGRIVFNRQPGSKRLFIVLSRDAKPDFENLVYSLGEGKFDDTKQARPAEPPPPSLRASIDNAAVGRLEQAYSRDLVIEKIGNEPGASAGEKAVYVVNPSGSADSCLVADLRLAHQ